MMIKKFGSIYSGPKFDEESDGATRFLIGPLIQGQKCALFRDVVKSDFQMS